MSLFIKPLNFFALNLGFVILASTAIQAAESIERAKNARHYEQGLSFNDFNTFELNGWKGIALNHGVFKVSPYPQAKFRSDNGLLIKGTLPKGQKASLILPLNLNKLKRPWFEQMIDHGSQILVRSNHNGALRYLYSDANDNLFISSHVLYSAGEPEAIKIQNTNGVINRDFLKSWQLAAFPSTQLQQKYENYGDHKSTPQRPLKPYAVELTVLGIEGEIEIHLDEFELSLGCMLKENQAQLALIPSYSAWPTSDSTLRALTFSPFEKWTAKSIENAVEVPVKCSAGMKGITIATSFPVQPIAKDAKLAKDAVVQITPSGIVSKLDINKAGIKGVRLHYSTSGIPHTNLQLIYANDRTEIRKDKTGKEVKFSENFAANIPLDLKGSHFVDLPFPRAGFPAYRNSEFAKDIISGNLQFSSFRLVNHSALNTDYSAEHKVILEQIELWVDPAVWSSTYPQLSWINDLSQKKKRTTDLNSVQERCYGIPVMSMDTLELSADKDKMMSTEPLLSINQAAAIVGNSGLSVQLPLRNPEEKVDAKHKVAPVVKAATSPAPIIKELRADLVVKNGYKVTSSPQGFRDHEAGIYLNCDAAGSIQYILKDANNRLIYSKPVLFKAAKSNSNAPANEEERIKSATWIEFPAVLAKRIFYGTISNNQFNPLSSIDYPVVPQGFRIIIPNPKSNTQLQLDEFQIWSGCMMKSARHLYTQMPVYAVPRKGDGEPVRVFDFESDQPWEIENFRYPAAGKTPEDNAKIAAAIKEEVDKAKAALEEGKKKMAEAQLKDPKAKLELSSFYRPTVNQSFSPAEISSLRLAAGEFGIVVNWPERKTPEPWERWSNNGLRLRNKGLWSKDSAYVMPLAEGVEGLSFTLEHSASPSSKLILTFLDTQGNLWQKSIELKYTGSYDYVLPFDNTGFVFDKKNKEVATDGIRPLGPLALAEFCINNSADIKGHHGEQNIRIKDFKLLVLNTAIKNLPQLPQLSQD